MSRPTDAGNIAVDPSWTDCHTRDIAAQSNEAKQIDATLSITDVTMKADVMDIKQVKVKQKMKQRHGKTKQEQSKRKDKMQNVRATDDLTLPEGPCKKKSKLNGVDGGKTFFCKICKKTFVRLCDLRRHERSGPVGCEQPFACAMCGKCFSAMNQVRRHERIHTGERPHACARCGKGFPSKYALLSHERKHTGERPYKCEHCDKSFSQLSNLVAHRRIHTGQRPFACVQCDKTFVLRAALLEHEMRLHREENKFKCAKCEKSFPSARSLRIHKKIHTDESHQCSICDRSFALLTRLRRHEKRHEKQRRIAVVGGPLRHSSKHRKARGEKLPFACDQCDRSYDLQTSLNRHIGLEHGSSELAKALESEDRWNNDWYMEQAFESDCESGCSDGSISSGDSGSETEPLAQKGNESDSSMDQEQKPGTNSCQLDCSKSNTTSAKPELANQKTSSDLCQLKKKRNWRLHAMRVRLLMKDDVTMVVKSRAQGVCQDKDEDLKKCVEASSDASETLDDDLSSDESPRSRNSLPDHSLSRDLISYLSQDSGISGILEQASLKASPSKAVRTSC